MQIKKKIILLINLFVCFLRFKSVCSFRCFFWITQNVIVWWWNNRVPSRFIYDHVKKVIIFTTVGGGGFSLVEDTKAQYGKGKGERKNFQHRNLEMVQDCHHWWWCPMMTKRKWELRTLLTVYISTLTTHPLFQVPYVRTVLSGYCFPTIFCIVIKVIMNYEAFTV